MIITTTDGRKYKRASRWIKIEIRYITKKHVLFDYADTYDCDDGEGLLTCFRHGGRLYALGQFMRFTTPEFYEDDNGKLQYLSGYDCTTWYKPLICEIDEGGEYIRLYQELDNDN